MSNTALAKTNVMTDSIHVTGIENISGLSAKFVTAFNHVRDSINTAIKSDLEVAFYLHRLSTCEDDFRLVCPTAKSSKSAAIFNEFAFQYFGFASGTTRSYKNIGSYCREVNGNVQTIFADGNGNDFTRSQMVELASVAYNGNLPCNAEESSKKELAMMNMLSALDLCPELYKKSAAYLRKFKHMIELMTDKGIYISDNPEILTGAHGAIAATESTFKAETFTIENGEFATLKLESKAENASESSKAENASESSKAENASESSKEENASESSKAENASESSKEENASESSTTAQKAPANLSEFSAKFFELLTAAKETLPEDEFKKYCEYIKKAIKAQPDKS